MRFFGKGRPESRHILGLGLILALLFAVACGSAAAPETTAPAVEAPAPNIEAESVPAPTAVPQAKSEPDEAMVEVHPGKLPL